MMNRVARPSNLLVLALIATAAQAGPTTPDKTNDPVSTTPEVRTVIEKPRSSDGGDGSRTIDLLIDMQQRGAGLQFNERQRATGMGEIKPRAVVAPKMPAANTKPPETTPRAEAPPTSPSGLFGSGATPMVQSSRAATVEPRVHAPAAQDAAAARRPAVPSNGESLPRWWVLPRELIEYVRDNRWLVLSSVGGGLLLIWGISALFGRAAANAGRVSGPPVDHRFSADRRGSGRHESRPARRRSHRLPG